MKLWIGIEGKVYGCLHVISYPAITRVGLAEEKEGKVGFLMKNETYFPVAYHSGKWVKAKESELKDFCASFLSQWYGEGSTPPFEYHFLFEILMNKQEISNKVLEIYSSTFD